MLKRVLLVAALLTIALTAADARFPRGASSVVATGWHQVKIGGGGFVTGISATLDSGGTTATKLARTDTAGAYIYNDSTLQWDQIVNTFRMPAAFVLPTANMGLTGAWEIVAAPSDTNTIYMAYQDRVFKSTNHGATFAVTGLASHSMVPNDSLTPSPRLSGPKMAVDPNNANVVYLATLTDGLFVTTNGGTSWSSVPNVTTSGTFPAVGIAFDTTSLHNCGAGSNQTCTIWIASNGSGVWRSTNGGTSFSVVAGGPSSSYHGKISTDGVYYALDLNCATGLTNCKLWRFQSSAWTDITPAIGSTSGLAVITPASVAGSAGTLVVAANGGGNFYSSNYGNAWTGTAQAYTLSSPEIPWMAVNEPFFACGDMVMDPVTNNLLWAAEGIGVWTSTTTSGAGAFTSKSKGIEQLVVQKFVSPPGGVPAFSAWDRPAWKISNPNSYPSGYGNNYSSEIEMGWSIDYASSAPTTLALLNLWHYSGGGDNSGYSTDNGLNWALYANQPAICCTTYQGGMIASATPDNILFAPANDGDMYSSQNATSGVAAWTRISGATWGNGMQDAGAGIETGWGRAYYYNNQAVCADRVTSNLFYAFNYQTSVLGGGLYKVRYPSGVLTPTRVVSGNIGLFANVSNILHCVPGYAGHTFYSAGAAGVALYRCVDTSPSTAGGTTTCTQITQAGQAVGTVYSVGTGAIKPGNDYPSVYIYGSVNGTLGMYRSDNSAVQWAANTVTWTALGSYAGGDLFTSTSNTDIVRTVAGDANTWGVVYVGFAGTTANYYTP